MLLNGISVDMVLFELLVVLGVAYGLVIGRLVCLGTMDTLGLAVLEQIGFLRAHNRAHHSCAVICDSIIMTSSLKIEDLTKHFNHIQRFQQLYL